MTSLFKKFKSSKKTTSSSSKTSNNDENKNSEFVNEDEYNFAYEIKRYAESLQKPLRTYRVEFNIGGPAGDGLSPNHTSGEEIYSSSYTTHSSKTTKTIYESTDYVNSRETTPSKRNGDATTTSVYNLKRGQHQPTNDLSRQFLDVPGIKDPKTGRILTVGEAIHLRILDVRTGEIYINTRPINLQEAVQQGYVDPNLANDLLQPNAAIDPQTGRSLCLLEVIQREISEAENGFESAEKRIKVNNAEDTVDASSSSVSGSGNKKVNNERPKSINDAIADGDIDPKTGLYHLEKDGQTISIAEAYEHGYLIKHESVTIKSNALCLSDAITHGLVDNSGWISDRNSGDKFRLDTAISNQLINSNWREIVDAKNDQKVTLDEAIKLGILNPKTGRYVNQVTKEKLTFNEAKNRQLILKPMTLKDVVDLNLYDKNNGKITSPMRREKLTIMQAINSGVLDDNNLKCVTKQKGELITLQEAIADGIILLSEAKYCDYKTGEKISIPEAVDRGLISSVHQKSLFNIDGFKDPYSNDFVSFNEAIARDILIRKNGEFFIDSGKGNLLDLKTGVQSEIIRSEVYEMFNRPIGVHDASGKELTVIDLVYLELLDPKTGYLLDPKTKTPIPLDTAIERKFITPEGALLLSSLLNITLTTETVTKTIKRYVTVTSGGTQQTEEVVLTFTEAVRQGFIDEAHQLFKDPKSGKIYSIQQALNFGLLTPDNDTNVPEPNSRKNKKSTLTIVTKQVIPEPDPIKLKSQKIIEKSVELPFPQKVDSQAPEKPSKGSKTTIKEFITHEKHITERHSFELPPEGWLLSDAIQQKLLDPETGLFLVPGTDRLVSFQECIQLQIINKNSASVIDPKNNRKTTIERSLEKKILDSTGNYKESNKKVINMKEAIKNEKIIFENPSQVDVTNQKIIQITKITGHPDVVEVSDRLGENPPQFVPITTTTSTTTTTTSNITRELPSPEPIQITPGAIYDPSTALVIFTQTGQSENILSAVVKGLIDPNLVKLTDPTTGEQITVSQAISKNIVDPRTGEVIDKSGSRLDLVTAAKLGALAVIGAPLVAAEGALKTIRFVTDPRTGEEIPVELAYERGIVSRDELSFDSSKGSTPTQTKSPEHFGVKSMTEHFINLEKGRLPITDHKRLISIGKTKSLSPEKETKIIVLQKMRKQILKPKDAVNKGIIDEVTSAILENKNNFTTPEGEVLTIEEALEKGLVDGTKGKIIDPQRGDVLNIKEAVERGIIDPQGTNNILLPIAKSISIPHLKDQGLIDPSNSKIVHPETGSPLSVKEAIICEVLDPKSKLLKPKTSLEKAIADGIIDQDESTVNTKKGPVDLLEAIEQKVFDPKETGKSLEEIPPVGMTFPVAVSKGLFDSKTNEIIHPITHERIPIKQAIDENLLMAVPYPPNTSSIELNDALASGIINADNGTMQHPKTGEIITIKEAVDSGVLVVKPLPEFVLTHSTGPVTSVTETITSVHTVTTKTIALLQGYAIVDNQIQNLQTGELISMEEAKQQGIVSDESETKETVATKEIKQNFADAVRDGLVDVQKGTFTDPKSGETITVKNAIEKGILTIETEVTKTHEKVSKTIEEEKPLQNMTITEAYETIYDEKTKQFKDPKQPDRLLTLKEAMNEGIVNPKSVVYDNSTGKVQTLEEGVKEGLINPKTGEVKQKSSGKSINIKEATKMGLLAVAAIPALPVIAGIKAVDSIKNALKKNESKTPEEKPIPKERITEKPTPKERETPIPIQRTKVEKTIEIVKEKPVANETIQIEIKKESPTVKDVKTEPAIPERKPETKTDIKPTSTEEAKKPSQKVVIEEIPEISESTTTTVTTTTVTTTSLLTEQIPIDESIKLRHPEKIIPEKPKMPSVDDFLNSERSQAQSTTPKQPDETVIVKVSEPGLSAIEHESVETVTSTVTKTTTTIETITTLSQDPSKPLEVTTVQAPQRASMNEFLEYERNAASFPESITSSEPSSDSTVTVIETYTVVKDSSAPITDIVDRQIPTVTIDKPQKPESLPIGDAISQNKIIPNECRVIVDGEEQPEVLQELLAEEKLSPLDEVRVIDDRLVELEKVVYLIGVNDELTIEKLTQLGLYDPEQQIFTDPATGQKISFQTLVFEMNIFDTATILVKNFSRNKYETLDIALERPLLDKHTGHMVDPKLGKKVPFFECIERGWIIRGSPKLEMVQPIENLIDSKTGYVILDNGQTIPISEAINSGVIDIQSISVRNPVSGEVIPLRMAIELGVVDLGTGTLLDIATNEAMTMEDAYKRGFLVPGARKPISLEAAVKTGLYDPESGKFLDTESQNRVDVEKSIKIGIVDPKISMILDTKNNTSLPLDSAIEDKLVEKETGRVKDTKSNELISFDIGIERQLLQTNLVVWSLSEVLQKEFYNPETGKVLSPITGKEITIHEAISNGFIEVGSSLIKDDDNDVLLPGKKAIDIKLIDAKKGELTRPKLTLDQAFVKGYIVSTKKPLSIVDCILRGLYDPNTGKFNIDGKPMTLKDAIAADEIINPNELIILDPKTNNIISVAEAIKLGYLDPVAGLLVDPSSGLKLTLIEALENRILIPPKRKRSLPDAVYGGLYDPKTGQFSNTITREVLSTERAIRRGILDPESTIVNTDGKVLPFEIGVHDGIIDAKRGTVQDNNGKHIDFKEAFDRGILIEAKKPLSLSESVVKNLYDEETGLFMDPKSGKKLTFSEVIEEKIIDPDSVQIRDPKTGVYKNLHLATAIEMGIIDPQTATVTYNNQRLTLRHAFEVTLLADSKAPVSIQRAIHQGLYDEKTGKIIEPKTGRNITILEATRKFIINPQLPCYFDEQNEKMLTLADACRSGLIDRREGVFREPGSDMYVSLNEALSLGLIVDIETASFGLYELLAMKFYDIDSRQVIQPVSSRLLTLRDACVEDIVSTSSSLVKDIRSNKYLRLGNAIKDKLIDDLDGSYVLPDGRKLDLQQARAQGLIVSNRKLLNLELALRMQLYKPETGKIIDPSTGTYYDLAEAIDSGLIDHDTTIFKNLVKGTEHSLKNAIENGDIDVAKGRILDPKTKTTYNYQVGFDKGTLITVHKPITERPIKKRDDSIELLATSPVSKIISKPREMSLDEAIRYEIIDTKTAVLKDFIKTFKFIPLSLAIEEGYVDLSKRCLVDPKAQVFAFDPMLVIYKNEPISFDDAVDNKSLDLTTGKLTFIEPLKTPTTTTASKKIEDVKKPEEFEVEIIEPKILTLKDATTQGLLDPDSALVKDCAKEKLVRLPEAFRKGLMDSEKANVLDTKTSKLCNLQMAYENGLIVTPKRAFGLLEAIQYKLYNPTNGSITDPFQTSPEILNSKRLTLNDAIQNGLIDPSTTMIKDTISENSEILPLQLAITNGIIDPTEGKWIDKNDKKNNLDLVKASEKNLLLPAEQRQAVFEKFNLCEETVTGLLKWIATVEQKIARVGGPKEKIDDLRNQINSLKQIKDEIESQSRPVASCLEQIRQIVLTGGDVLSAPEVTSLENSGRELRGRVDTAANRTQRLLKRLEASRDELSKLSSELDIFSNWLQDARRTLEDKERALSDLNRLASQAESIREFVSDVIAHQADLRFITMAAQKFVDESKDFLNVLNEFRTSLPDRLPHIEPLASSESPIRQEVSLVSTQYKDLLHRSNNLSDRLSGLGGRQREYQDAVDKAREWLRIVQPHVTHVLNDPIAADPQSVQDQMSDAKKLHNEFLQQGRLIDNCQQALDTLLRSLQGQLSPSEVSALEIPVEEIKDKYNQLLEALGDRCKLLDTALVKSQGVQDALDGLVSWVNQAEDKFNMQFRPASLIKERLQEQIREHRQLVADIQSHQASIDSVTTSAHDLMPTASNARLVKKIEQKLNDVTTKFEKLLEKVIKRGEFLDDVLSKLTRFLQDSTSIEQELCMLQEALESREIASLDAGQLAHRMNEMSRMKEKLRPHFEDCVKSGKDLISMRDVTDTGGVRDRVKALETQWKNLDTSLDEKARLSKQKAEQLNAYENLKDQVLAWLASIEARTNSLQPVAVDIDLIRRQIDELKPIQKDYRDYGPTIDKVNDLGTQYDALIQLDSPGRKRSSYSPVTRPAPGRRLSGENRTPSPTKGGQSVSPLSPGSSGFGSRRSSQDGFQINESSPIQQQLGEINNRYGLVGIRLNDRQNELDSLKDEVKKHQDNLKALANFLDKAQRQVPKEQMASKDEAERSTRTIRKILDEMYEKQSLLDSTKTQIKDLLRRKPDVPGADRLRNELENVAERWKALYDLCKNRIDFSEQLRDFLDTHGNLINWLNSKERMLTVLGPISSDPRMVQSQVEQVQVLREEFRTQQPQLNHLQDVGHAVLDQVKETSPEGQSVVKKLRECQNKWDDLVGRLDERANSLGGAADSSKEFDAALNRLREALQNISDNLDALPVDKDHQENLRKIENLERQLEGQRPLLADVEQAAAALCKVLSDPASKADVNNRVAALEKQYQALQKKLDNRKAETEAALRDGRQFAESCSKTLGWLAGELSNLSERLLVSAHKPTLQHQIDTHEPIYREVMAREHEIIMLINKGKDLANRPGSSPDRAVLRDLERIQQQWDKLRRDAVDRHTRLQTCMEHCKKYSQTSELFLTWLRTAEDKLADLRPGILKKSEIDRRLRELQTFRSEVWKKSGEYENTKGLGDTFLTACDVDKDPIKNELQDMRERWDRLNNDLLLRAQELESCANKLADFNDDLRNLDHSVGRCEDRLAAHDSLGGAAKDPKLLDRVKAIREDVTVLKKPLEKLRHSAADIAQETRAAGGDAEHLVHDVENLGDRIGDLLDRLNDRCGELQSAATAVSQFNEQVKNLGLDLADLENLVDNLTPPGREIKVVQSQIKEVSIVLDKIDQAAGRVADLERAGENLVDSGFSPDTVQTRDQIITLKKTLLRLENRGKDHEESLHIALKNLQNFYDLYSHLMDDLKDISDEVKRMKPISSALEEIKHQQEDFRRFRDRKVEPMAQTVSEINRDGRDLVRSAQNGVSTAILEKDIEKMNEKWNDLKEKLNDRDRRLDIALLQSGKFQDALNGLSKWLSDTEDMVANQKPPSADYKVVKAQLQEQKFLKKMLLDRQNSMSSLFTLGKEVAANCEPSEKKAIESQLKELMGRFDALTEAAQQREKDLEQAMEVAKLFHDKLAPLIRWLDNTERSVKNMEMVPTDEEKIQQRIREHDKLHDEILSKKPDFSELTDIATQLMDLVGEDEAVSLGEKVRTTTDRYTTLVESSENIGRLLAESRQGLRHLVLTYQELVAWMESMEKEFHRYRVVPVHTEKVLEQMDHLVELNENVANHASSVESTVDAGSELMKHISSDEAIQLKDKLDSLQRRYGELANKGATLLKNAQEALPLVQQFHEAHNRLVEWMQGAEGVLATGEPRQADILRLETELADMRPVLETVNLVGPQLCQISPGEGASTIESLVTRDNRRFDAIVEKIQRMAERLHLSNQRAKEVTTDIDELLEWFRDMDSSLRDADAPALDPQLVRAQLQEHRSINDDISSQKGRVRDVTAAAKKVLRESPQNDYTTALREKLEDLKEVVDTVVQLCSERLSILEQALPLSEHFADSHNGLASWLDEIEHQLSILSNMPALRPDQIVAQQDKNERLIQSISEHKPLLDKLNKTGEALAALVTDDDAAKIQEILDSDNGRYAALKTELRERQQALERALQESSQFSDKLEGMLRALANTCEQVQNADPISAIPQKIVEQIEDNSAIVDDLNKRSEAYNAVTRAANEVISKAPNKQDPAVRDIKKKLDKLNDLWNEAQNATKKRGRSLDDALAIAEKFWKQLKAVMDTLKDLEETLSSQEPPAAQPQEIKKQQVALQEIRHEIDQTKPEVEEVRRKGQHLMQLCGEPDKPEVKKNIEDLDHSWDNITALYARREENLIDAMEKAMEFHETLQNLLKFFARAEERFANLGPIGSDIEAVKRQIEQLKHFKDEVDPHMVEIEALNRQAAELTERTSIEQKASIREPLNAVNQRWDNLLRGMVERQKQLEHALLHLGQFQHALNELLVWIARTDQTLDQLKPIPGDPQLLEVELAKLKVLANDIQAHQSSVDTLNDAGRQLIESERGSVEASKTQEKLRKLNDEWRTLIQKSSDRQHELEEALREAQGFISEVQDILGWLGDVDAVIGASKPVGGLPETATEQLERFMEVYNELEENRPKVETLQSQGQEYIKKQNQMKVSSSNLTHILRTLKQRWDAVLSRASDKKIKLEIALKEATEFHDTLQAFVEWLTQAEKQLSTAAPVSRVLETIQTQIEEHKILQKDVSTHREAMLLLDKKGTHLKYFSQKQDVILIKNLLVSVQHRWERVVAKAAERTRALDHGYKEAREFHDSWVNLIQWLQETEETLDQLTEEATNCNEAQKIKKFLDKLKDIQRNLSAKQSQYDTTMRSGKNLIDRAPKSDEQVLNRMLVELKETWTRVCTKSVDRQRKFEEALLLSGQFSDALQALLDWLKKTRTRLSDQGPVHGDLETVTTLVENHKHLEQDLQKRSAQMQQVLRTGRDLERSGDNRDIGQKLTELQSIWSDVEDLSSKRGYRLQDALREAEKLHKSVHMLLEWLSEAEQKLRYAQATPDDENSARELLEIHTKFMRELREKERDKDNTLHLAQSILDKAHPDAIPIIKNWMTIIQSRWDEVSQWAIGRENKLRDNLQSLRDLDDTIEELLKWLAGLEATLINLEREPLPDEIPPLEQLIADHKEFMENTARRQPEVDRACKPKQPLAGTKEARKPSRPSKTPVRGSSHDIREQSPDYYSASRRQSRLSPSRDRDTPDRVRLPHYGPRFSPSNVPEAEFRSPRAKLLWDKWRHTWMLAWERQRRLHEHLLYLQDVERVRNFNWEDWRKRFLKHINNKKSRLTDLYRKMDKTNDGLIPRDVFIDGILNTKFDTSRLEMGAVADRFDLKGEGLIDWDEFMAALRADWMDRKPLAENDKIHDEVKRLVMLCTCRQKFRVFQVGEGKYRFGDSQKLRLVRILRSTVMVRVGGGWVALDEFLQKNDPCRAKGRTNIELREQFILADGVTQTMAAFKPKLSASSRAGSPSYTGSATGPITKVRERSSRSSGMSRPTRSSLSASTPDSLSDNESVPGRKASYTPRSGLTPGGSKPNSRPASRQGSKPPSRHGSNLSLDSTDDTPSRIPRRPTNFSTSSTLYGTPTSRSTRLQVGTPTSSRTNGTTTTTTTTITRKTVSGSASPAPTRRNLSGSSTPSGMQTPRKSSMDPPTHPPPRKSRGGTPTQHREPFRL